MGEVEGGVVERESMHGGPEIEDVAVRGTVGVKAAERLPGELYGERAVSIVRFSVNRAGSAELRAAALQAVEPAEMTQHLFHRHLGAEGRVVDPRTRWAVCYVDRSGRRR